MRILHTSDWHIGSFLYGKRRYEEIQSFLKWLIEIIQKQRIDVLLVAGDIFDNGTPSNRAQEIYYQFLNNIKKTSCQSIVIIAGNHDSPSFLDAPKNLLKSMDIYVIGSLPSEIEDEVFVLKDKSSEPFLIVAAVPYLRDKDIRISEAGEEINVKEQKIISGIREHYAKVGQVIDSKLKAIQRKIPVVGMGHLFTAGGKIEEGDGVRELYIGLLGYIHHEIFPKNFDYIALGHLHIPQKVSSLEHIRYCGAPIPMSFGEAHHQKSVCIVDIFNNELKVEEIKIPIFQKLERIRGSRIEILNRIKELSLLNETIWLEIIYDDNAMISNLRELLEDTIKDSKLEILSIKNQRSKFQYLHQENLEETLESLSVKDVFERCLEKHEVTEEQRIILQSYYQEILIEINESGKEI